MPLITDDFLLESAAARRLYHEHAASQPILDYHCHLDPAEIAADAPFADLFAVWLAGDHYKWRAMRANGVPERYCTGDASPYEKFSAWAATVPRCLRNPLYHWTHLELQRIFGINELLSPSTADSIWKRANAVIAKRGLSPRKLFAQFRVRAVCTTDDPAVELVHHPALAGSRTRVYPTFRPDQALGVDQPAAWNAWLERLGATAQTSIDTLADLLAALAARHAAFHALGGRLSDHGLEHAYAEACTPEQAAAIFARARQGQAATAPEHAQFASFLMLHFGRLDAEKGWTKQLHLGARRNTNTRMRAALGPDTGFDSIGDWPQVGPLLRYWDQLEQEGKLPQSIVYNLNPADNAALATAIGNFQDGSVPGKMQWGAAWWFLDQIDGMTAQLNTLSNMGLLSRFVGMLTDSRSFLSYPRHEYFRRILCNVLGGEMERGLLPGDFDLVGGLVEDVCFNNARDYLGLELSAPVDSAA